MQKATAFPQWSLKAQNLCTSSILRAGKKNQNRITSFRSPYLTHARSASGRLRFPQTRRLQRFEFRRIDRPYIVVQQPLISVRRPRIVVTTRRPASNPARTGRRRRRYPASFHTRAKRKRSATTTPRRRARRVTKRAIKGGRKPQKRS